MQNLKKKIFNWLFSDLIKEFDEAKNDSVEIMEALRNPVKESKEDSDLLSNVEIDEFGCERVLGSLFTINPESDEKYAIDPISHKLISYPMIESLMKKTGFYKKYKLAEDFSDAAVSSEILRDFIGFYGGSLANNNYFEWNFQKQRLMFERSYEECQKGVGKAIKDITTNFVLGDGISFEYTDIKIEDPQIRDQIHSVLWKIWQDNDFDQKQYTISDFIVERGEVFIKVTEDYNNDVFDIEVIDPWEMTDYLYDPQTRKVKAWFRDYYRNGQQVTGEPLLVEGGIDQWTNAPYTLHHYKFNVPDTLIRGRSDIYCVLYWIKIYNDFLKCRSRVNRFRSSVAWHKQITGGTRAISGGATKVQKPFPPGTVLVTDDKTTYKAIEAKIQAGDVKDDGDAFKIMIASAIQIPHHWLFGSGENTNLATAKNMSAVPKRKFMRRQKDIKTIFQNIFWMGLQFYLNKEDYKRTKERYNIQPTKDLDRLKEAIISYNTNKYDTFTSSEDQFKFENLLLRKKHLEIQIPNIDEHNSEDLKRICEAAKILRDAGIGSNHALYDMVGINYRKDQELLENELKKGDYEAFRTVKRIFNNFDNTDPSVLDTNADGIVDKAEEPAGTDNTDAIDDTLDISKSPRGGS